MLDPKEVLFPFNEMREGQESFMKVVRTALNHKKSVLSHMPTGIGKTVSALSPSLRYALDNNKTVIFLTPKHTHHRIAIETLKKIKDRYDLNFSVVDFIGKKWMCARDDVDFLSSNEFREYCNGLVKKKECPFYENYYDIMNSGNVEKTLEELRNKPMHVEELHKFCKENNICPFEAAIDLAKNSKVVVGDYFHVLNPSTRDVFFRKIEKELKNCIIIWDEAHNLPDRARDLMSISLNNFVLEQAIKEAEQYNQDLGENLVEINTKLMNLTEKLGLNENEIILEKNDFKVDNLYSFIDELRETAENVIIEKKRSFLNSVAEFLESWDQEEEGYIRLLSRGFSKSGKPVVSVNHKCLDPRLVTKEVVEGAHCNIFMSGTLHPLDMYEDILGLELPIKVEYENPFPEENRLDLVVPLTSTKYSKRSQQMYEEISEIVDNLIEKINGNTIVFFPSYDLRDQIYPLLEEKSNRRIFLEKSEDNKEEKNNLLWEMIKLKDEGVVLLSVSGGSFGEGINLKREALKGVIIVGIPYAKNDLENKELVKYYDLKFGKGMDYGYIMPAFVKILQNSGRCIRSDKDVGTIIYLDERYGWKNYKKYFPEKMKLYHSTDLDTVKRFFENKK